MLHEKLEWFFKENPGFIGTTEDIATAISEALADVEDSLRWWHRSFEGLGVVVHHHAGGATEESWGLTTIEATQARAAQASEPDYDNLTGYPLLPTLSHDMAYRMGYHRGALRGCAGL